MNTNFYFKEYITRGKEILTQNVKLVLYKQSPTIFDEVDFEKDEIYLDPLLFAAINTKQDFNATEILLGYKSTDFQKKSVEIKTDENGNIFLPNIGYFYTDEPLNDLSISLKNDQFVLKNNTDLGLDYSFEPRLLIHNLFEVLKHPHFLLKEHFYSAEGKLVQVEVSEITQFHLTHLNSAFDLIKAHSADFYELLKDCVRSIVIFKSESYEFLDSEVVARNSFATLSVHGCAFINAFQEEYNEVFFVEDIAHQCGHVIFNTYLAAKPNIFKIDSNSNIASPEEVEQFNEERSLFVVMHAMYTYDSILKCLSNCAENNVFEDHKLHELFGRLAFNCYKFTQDYKLLSQIDSEGKSVFFTDEGLLLLDQFLETYKAITQRWKKYLEAISLNNQPYNFSYKIFLETNPLIR